MTEQTDTSVKLEIVKASEIVPKEVRWLCYPYIPFGKVTLLQGDPGDGKGNAMTIPSKMLPKARMTIGICRSLRSI